jgi:hypothetical protein
MFVIIAAISLLVFVLKKRLMMMALTTIVSEA